MSKVESAVQWAINIANNDIHGYSQIIRFGPSYDCSSLVISAFQQAGILLKTHGATYTANMAPALRQCGFANVTSRVNLATGAGMQRGDILLNTVNHTAIYIGSGKIVHARSSEGTSDTADNSGNEIRVQNYFNYPWNEVWRYNEGNGQVINQTPAPTPTVTTNKTTLSTSDKDFVKQVQHIIGAIEDGIPGPETLSKTLTLSSKINRRHPLVKVVQQRLMSLGYSLPKYGADGDFGSETEAAVIKYQRDNGCSADGEITARALTWKKLLKLA